MEFRVAACSGDLGAGRALPADSHCSAPGSVGSRRRHRGACRAGTSLCVRRAPHRVCSGVRGPPVIAASYRLQRLRRPYRTRLPGGEYPPRRRNVFCPAGAAAGFGQPSPAASSPRRRVAPVPLAGERRYAAPRPEVLNQGPFQGLEAGATGRTGKERLVLPAPLSGYGGTWRPGTAVVGRLLALVRTSVGHAGVVAGLAGDPGLRAGSPPAGREARPPDPAAWHQVSGGVTFRLCPTGLVTTQAEGRGNFRLNFLPW
jgi:hypothetical protein